MDAYLNLAAGARIQNWDREEDVLKLDSRAADGAADGALLGNDMNQMYKNIKGIGIEFAEYQIYFTLEFA